MADKLQEYNLQEYTDNLKKQSEVKLNNQIEDYLTDAPLTTTIVQNEIDKAQAQSNYTTMQGIAGRVNKLDSNEETARSRYLKDLSTLETYGNNFLLDEEEIAKIKETAEDKEEGNNNIIFEVLDAFTKPMYALEGAFVGLFARNDEHFDGLSIPERVLAGVHDGWSGAEDEEGNRIVTDAAVVASLLNGSHDVSSWDSLTRLTIGLGTMWMFGKYDPMMKAFSLLAENSMSIKAGWQGLRDKGFLPKVFQSRVFDSTSFQDSFEYVMKANGNITKEMFEGSMRTFFDKIGLTQTKMKYTDFLSGETREFDYGVYAKELDNIRRRLISNANIDGDIYKAHITNINNHINDAVLEALQLNDVETLNQIGAFNVVDYMTQDSLDRGEAMEYLREKMLLKDGDGLELRKAIYQETTSRLMSSMLKDGQYHMRMIDVLSDLVSGKGTRTVMTQTQIKQLFGKMVQTGMIDHDFLLNLAKSNKAELMEKMGPVGKLKEEIKVLKKTTPKQLEKISAKIAKEYDETLEEIAEHWKTFNEAGMETYGDILNDYLTGIDGKPLFSEADNIQEFFSMEIGKEDEFFEKIEDELAGKEIRLKELLAGDSSKELAKQVNAYDEMIHLLSGGDFSPNKLELYKLESYITDAKEANVAREKKIKKQENKVLNQQKRVEKSMANIVGSQGGELFTEGQNIYKQYANNYAKYKDLKTSFTKVGKSEHADRLNLLLNKFTNPATIVDKKAPEYALNTNIYKLPRERVDAILKDIKDKKPEVYKELKPIVDANKEGASINRITEKRLAEIEDLIDTSKVADERFDPALTTAEIEIWKAANNVKKDFEKVVNEAEFYIRYEKGLDGNKVKKQLEETEKLVIADRERLTKIFKKYEEVILKNENYATIKDDIKSLKAAKYSEQGHRKILDRFNRDHQTALSTLEGWENDAKELSKLVKKESLKPGQSMGYKAFLNNVSQNPEAVGSILKPLIDEMFDVRKASEQIAVDKTAVDGENIFEELALYTFRLNNKEGALGKEWGRQLRSFYNGEGAQKANEAFRPTDLPMVSSRLAEGLSEYVKIGTKGFDLRNAENSKLSQMVDGLKSLQASIYNDIFGKSFKMVDDGSEIAKEIMLALHQRSDAWFDPFIDNTLAVYQKKQLNTQLAAERKQYEAKAIADDLLGREKGFAKQETGGRDALKESGYRGSVRDINHVRGTEFAMEKGSTYDKYDITQQLFMENPIVTLTEQVRDAQRFGEFGAVLTHAMQNGVILTAKQAPAELVKRGRLVSISADELAQSLKTMLKFESESNSEKLIQQEIAQAKKLESVGLQAETEEEVRARFKIENANSDRRGEKMVDNLLSKYYKGALDVAEDNNILFVPREFWRAIMPKELPPEQVKGVLAFYDKLMNAWKTLTLFSPGFNFKNLFGNFASQYMVDPASLTAHGLSYGTSMFHDLTTFNQDIEMIKNIAVSGESSVAKYDDFIKEYLSGTRGNTITSGEHMDEFVRDFFREFDDDFGHKYLYSKIKTKNAGKNAKKLEALDAPINSMTDLYDFYKEAELSRVTDTDAIQNLIGRFTNKGNPAVALSNVEIGKALRATESVQELSRINPGLANVLDGTMKFDTKNTHNVAAKLINWNVAMSHDITSAHKLNQLANNKKYELKEFNKFIKERGLGEKKVKTISEMNDHIASKFDDATRGTWLNTKQEMYRRKFGYESSENMIQDMFFDPGALYGIEASWLSRIVPFWGFFKKSLELSFSRINKLDFRGMYGIERALLHIMHDQDIAVSDMSEFARNEQYIPIKVGDNKILNIKWGNPTQTLNNLIVRDKNLLAELYGNANPLLKFMTSEIANREDLFFGGKYDSIFEEAFATMAPGAVRNVQRQIKYQNEKDSLDMDHQKSILAELIPSVFKDEVISDNQYAAYNAAALYIEKKFDDLYFNQGYTNILDNELPEPPSYQDFIFDLY